MFSFFLDSTLSGTIDNRKQMELKAVLWVLLLNRWLDQPVWSDCIGLQNYQ